MNNLKIYLDTGTNLQEVIYSQGGVVRENTCLGARDIFFDFTATAFIMRCITLSGSEFSELEQITAINSSLVSLSLTLKTKKVFFISLNPETVRKC